MKAALTSYWFIGCLLVGSSLGLHFNDCPLERNVKSSNVLIEIITWPATVVTFFVARKEVIERLTACRTAP